MLQLIAGAVLIGSLAGMGIIIGRRVPQLKKVEPGAFPPRLFWFRLERRLKKQVQDFWEKTFNSFSWELFLQKTLSRVRILTLKIEAKVGDWLEQSRKRAKERREREVYWRHLTRFSREKKGDKNKPGKENKEDEPE